MTVRCKFKCVSKTPYSDTAAAAVKFLAVTSGSPENEKFFKWTPNGSLDIGTINEEAAAEFEPGKEYYLDITPAD